MVLKEPTYSISLQKQQQDMLEDMKISDKNQGATREYASMLERHPSAKHKAKLS